MVTLGKAGDEIMVLIENV